MEEKEKQTETEELVEKLVYKKKNIYENADGEEIKKIYDFAEGYMKFLDNSKTEREACEYSVKLAREAGFKEFKFGDKLKVGDKRYFVNRNKSVVVFSIGKNNLEKYGVKLLGAHIDSPRLDFKPNPVYEDSGFCFLKTHYYGGIKKYQWTTIPLAIHGTVVLGDGKVINVKVGEDESDPVFYINDLLPHLGQEQMRNSGNNIITGEQLNVVVGGLPYVDKKAKDKIKLNFLSILNKKYGITEADFMSAELCVVPAYKAREVGFDRAFISAYGHDDKSCSYPALQAVLNAKSSDTVIAMLVDKEEIGSEGVTGMKSRVYEDLLNEICDAFGARSHIVRAKSRCLSADVTSCFDPNFTSVYEKTNASIISCGTTINKYTGAGGKSGASDASAEFVGEVRKIFTDNNIMWQAGELGKVDVGGGGTIAKYVADLNIDTVDIGVPVISMHSPYELISKADLYSTYKAFSAFVK